MDHGTNWDRLALRQLDKCITSNANAEDENDPEYYVRIDFGPMFGHKSSMIKEILEKGHKKVNNREKNAINNSSISFLGPACADPPRP